ncbi:PaaI family thioesterase [bacterium]|nr:PaaI family thioesterase [bacterium]
MSSTAFIDNDFCFACGSRNPLGLQLSFHREGDMLCTRVVPTAHWQGWENVMHGGIQATILDDLMSNYFFRIQGVSVVTAELSTRFKAPVPLDRELVFRAWLTGRRGRVWEAAADCRVHGDPDGRVLSSATGRFLETPSTRPT